MKVMDLWSLREKLIQSINHSLFGNQNLLEDLKIEEYHSTGEYFTALPEVFSDAIRQRCASINI